MRSVVFRALAGVLAIAFMLALVADGGQMPLRQAFWIGALGVGFGLYAALGTGPAERLLVLLFGGLPKSGRQRPAEHLVGEQQEEQGT